MLVVRGPHPWPSDLDTATAERDLARPLPMLARHPLCGRQGTECSANLERRGRSGSTAV
jgi:hypothetical protein